ncbi:MAG: 16S rRNA (cytosine(967)-C(5))-methyltransferase RsmB [Tissierellia bacterium]|nr:16S rRNA (cytosine(967)-C(5))-methyltransferase RsmB [Tissierellia bacterium]
MSERRKILQILEDVENGGYLGELLNHGEYSDLVVRTCYGIIENLRLLDHYISVLSHKNREDQRTKNILRMSIYHLDFFDGIPEYAVVNEANKLADRRDRKYVNAILRNYLRKSHDMVINDPRILYSVHDDVYDLLIKEYKKKTVKKILESFLQEKEMVIRIINREAIDLLQSKGYILKEIPSLEEAFILCNPKDIFSTEVFKNGWITVQGASSILTSKILAPKKNSLVLDLCAAPGGKTAHLSHIMGNTGHIVANDIHGQKKYRMMDNFRRLHCKNIEITHRDGTIFHKPWEDQFDYVLIDAPCSGLGEAGKKPEIKIRRTREDIEELVETQKKLVQQGIRYVKKGGFLVYSTCTILKDENENIRKEIMKDLQAVPIYAFNDDNPFIKTMPYQEAYTGFFISKFQK